MKSNTHKPKFIFFILSVFFLLFTFSYSYAFDEKKLINELLTGIENRYSQQSFEAKFSQFSRLQALDITEEAKGKAYFSHPGKMIWEYHSPENHKIITNGKTIWIYRPSENQVMVGDASELFKNGAGGAFLSDISIIRKDYSIRIKEINDKFAEIDLVSKVENPDISSITIKIARQSSVIQKIVTYNAYGDTTRFDFTQIKFKPLDKTMFEFKTPDNVSIIKMN